MSWNALETCSSLSNSPALASSRIRARLAPAQKWVPSCEITRPRMPRSPASSTERCNISSVAPSSGLNSGCSAEWNSTQPTPSPMSTSEALQLRSSSPPRAFSSSSTTTSGATGTKAIERVGGSKNLRRAEGSRS